MPSVLFSIFVAAQLALAIALTRKYIRTRDAGFIWLGAAILLWPLVSNYAFRGFIGRLANRQPIGFYPFSLVEHGPLTVGELVAAGFDADRPRGHLSAGDAGRLARRGGAKLLVLTHLRAWHDQTALLAEAAAECDCPVLLATPGLRVALPF